MTTQTQEVTFTVEDVLVVADPCYVDTDDGATEAEVVLDARASSLSAVIDNAAGEWTAEAEAEDKGPWGDRVARLVLHRSGFYTSSRGRLVGENGVDSGQMYAGCATTLPLDYEALLESYRDEDGEWQNRPFFAFGGGAVSSTGYGDGSYAVYVTDGPDGRPARVEVDFIPTGCEGCGQPEDECECCWRCGRGPDWCTCDDDEEE